MATRIMQVQTEKWQGCFECAGRSVALALEASDEGLVSCMIVGEAGEEPGLAGQEGGAPRNPHLKRAVAQLRAYFDGSLRSFDVALAPAGATPFQKKAWQAARQIPFGQTRSYWWVAVRLGDPYAVRAVGGAMAANPLLLFVPCHRVVRQDNSLGGFSCGLAWKQFLLEHETAAALEKRENAKGEI